MPDNRNAHRPLRFPLIGVLLALSMGATISSAQTPDSSPYYARKNTFGIFGAYSGNSSHILLGDAENRRLVEIGGSYSRRLIMNHAVNWQYDAELLPVVLESDPMSLVAETVYEPNAITLSFNSGPPITCTPVTTTFTLTNPTNGATYNGSTTVSCHGRRWVVAQGMSPVGFRWNFRPQRKLQPFLSSHGGYMYSSQAIPIQEAGSFNFTFDVGAGFELYRSRSRSIRAEYRYHHTSNDNTAQSNPGIDNGLVQVTYCFGR